MPRPPPPPIPRPVPPEKRSGACDVLEEMDLMWIPVHRSWKLNERHYGALQGLDKQDTVNKYGCEQVQSWRRYYNVLPPALVKHLDNISDEDIVGVNIPTGTPLVYELDDGLRPKNCHYLKDDKDIRETTDCDTIT